MVEIGGCLRKSVPIVPMNPQSIEKPTFLWERRILSVPLQKACGIYNEDPFFCARGFGGAGGVVSP